MVRRGCLVELLQGAADHNFKVEVFPVKYSSWQELTFVVISRSCYQPVGQRVIMSRGSYKWDKKVRNGDGN